MRTITFILIAIVALGGLSACKQTVTPPVNPTAMSTATAPPLHQLLQLCYLPRHLR